METDELRPTRAEVRVQPDQQVLAGCAVQRVTIGLAENGFIVNIGCKTFVSKDWQEVSDGLKLYFENPKEAEEKYSRKK